MFYHSPHMSLFNIQYVDIVDLSGILARKFNSHALCFASGYPNSLMEACCDV
jgi:hypothetical protein